MSTGRIASLSRSPVHEFSKNAEETLRLLEGFGIEGDAHGGDRVQHRSRVEVDPTQPNLRQVHLLHAELLRELAEDGFAVGPGQLGENILTEGLDLLGLPAVPNSAHNTDQDLEVTAITTTEVSETFNTGFTVASQLRDHDDWFY